MPEQKITLAYRLDFEQSVWQIRFDAEAGWLALECREPEVLQVSYSVVEVPTGKLLVSNYNPVNSWWTGLADINVGLLYLHQRGTKGLGQPAGLIALAVPSGEIRWQQPGYSFYGLTRNYILARPVAAEDTAVVGLNFETGVVEGEAGTLKEMAASLDGFQAQRSSAFQVPLHYPAENIYFEELSRFVLLKTGIRAQWAIDYLENQDLLLIGFYSENARGGKSYRVAIFNRAGNLLGQEELVKNLTGLGTDNFFVFQKNLFLLKDKKSLLAFRF